MEDFNGLEPTGRELKGPIGTLVEYTPPEGLKRTGIVIDPEFGQHEELRRLEGMLGFLENPGVCNLLEVTEYDAARAVFAYPTGTCWSVAELISGLADLGEKAGARAGLELCYLVASVLHEASRVATDAEIYSHGSLNPWRIMVKVDGQIQLIGYGIPQVDVLVYREEDGALPNEDSLRYCPPERLEGNPEDVAADILSLALVVFELMVGEPLYNGLAKEIHQQAINGQGVYRLFQFRDVLPDSVIDLLSRALKYDADARFADANQFVWEVKDVIGLPEIDGMTLAEVVQTVRQGREHNVAIMGGKTSSMSKADLQAMRELLDAPDSRPLPAPPEGRPEEEDEDGQPRWGRVSRVRASGEHTPDPEPEPVSEPDPEPEESVRVSQSRADTLRARLRKSKEDRRQSLRDRLNSDRKERKLRESQEEEEEYEEPYVEEDDDEGGREESLEVSEEGEFEDPEGDESDEVEDIEDDDLAEDEPEGDDVGEDSDVEEESVSEKPEDAAAALLARLRSSQDLRASQSDVASGSPDASDSVRPEVTGGADAKDNEAIAPRPLLSSTPNLAASGSQRVPFQVYLSGQAPRTVKLKLSDSICETASRLGQALAGIPLDLGGRLTGWYRVRQSGVWISGSSMTESLDAGAPVEVAMISAQTRRLTIEIDGVDVPARFQAPVGLHIPSAYLASHLAQWLELPAGTWSLSVNGEQLLPMQTLAEFDLNDGAVVVVKL